MLILRLRTGSRLDQYVHDSSIFSVLNDHSLKKKKNSIKQQNSKMKAAWCFPHSSSNHVLERWPLSAWQKTRRNYAPVWWCLGLPCCVAEGHISTPSTLITHSEEQIQSDTYTRQLIQFMPSSRQPRCLLAPFSVRLLSSIFLAPAHHTLKRLC